MRWQQADALAAGYIHCIARPLAFVHVPCPPHCLCCPQMMTNPADKPSLILLGR